MLGKFVNGEGNPMAEIFIVGEGPGRMESNLGRPFVGPAGASLNWHLLHLCHLPREQTWITNLVRYRTDEDNSDPTEQDIARDEPYLYAELGAIKPKIIITVGAIATRYFLGDVSMEFVHALPNKSDKWPEAVIFPVYHPAAGLHQADRYSKLVYNSFKRLGAYLQGELTDVSDPFTPFYAELDSLALSSWFRDKIVGLDTEGLPQRPWGLSVSDSSGDGWVWRPTGQPAALNADKYVLHNALWDLKVLRAMGINIPYNKIDDTMIQAHLLCVEPKKLKALAYRECGMEMENYQDVIKEADDRIAYAFLRRVADGSMCGVCKGAGKLSRPWKNNPAKLTKPLNCEKCGGDGTTLPTPGPQLVFNDDFTAKLYIPESAGRRLRFFLGSSGNFRDKWDNLDYTLRRDIEARFGVMPHVTLDDVEPRSRAINYSARDADATLRVYHRLRPRIHAMGLDKAYELDINCIPIIDRMHQNGILINKDHFSDLSKKFKAEQLVILQKMHDEVGVYFNPTGPIQIKKELAKLGLKDLESTNEKTLKLAKIKANDPKISRLIDYGLEYRELNKLVGTYTDKLPRTADANKRIHTTFILAAQENSKGETAEAPSTGRFSSRDPNLQNIPTATDRGNSIRAGFIARPGCKLLSVDLSQIELRVGAHLAREANMIEAFNSGLDLHSFTAAKMFHKTYEECNEGPGRKKYRYPAKTISFGIFYGMSKYRLQSELAVEGLTISLDEAQAFIDAWFQAYPGIKTYMHNVQAEARQNCFVRTMFGHIRYLPNVHSKDDRIREEALRQAGNHPVQGSAGEILKIAMANVQSRVFPEMNRMGYFEPLLTIHDEIVLEVEEGIAEMAAAMVTYEMENATKLLVPLLSSYKIADNWGELK